MSAIPRLFKRFWYDLMDISMFPDPDPSIPEWPVWDPTILQSGFRLRVLTLNTWALPIAPYCEKRAMEIGEDLKDKADIIAFQEVWHRRERNILIDFAKKSGYQYYHYFKSAVGFPLPYGEDGFGTGHLVISKYPIVEIMYKNYSLSGKPFALHEADFIAGKGVGLLRIATPAGQIDVYVTHFLANYNYLGAPGPGDNYFPHRSGQSFELSQFIEATKKNELILILGDFNSPPECLCLRLMWDLNNLRDSYSEKNTDEGTTFGNKDNKYSHGDHPMRMDYVLYKFNPRNPSIPMRWSLDSSQIYKKFFVEANGEKAPVSDHFGVMADFIYGSAHEQKYGEVSHEGKDIMSSPSPCMKGCMCSLHKDFNSLAIDIGLFGHSAEKCLHELIKVLAYGREIAVRKRQDHWHLYVIGSIVLLFLFISRYQLGWMTISNIGIPLVIIYNILQYFFAHVILGSECLAFTELHAQARIQLHYLKSGEAFM